MNKNPLVWLIPVLALAVPGFLFYNWWTNLNAQTRRDLEKKAKGNPALAAFMGGGGKNNLTNPLSQGAAPMVVASTETAAAPVSAPASTETVANANPAAPIQAAPSEPAAISTAPAAPIAVAATAGITIARDPTLSPYDMVFLEQKRLEDEARKNEINDAVRRPVRKPTEPPVENSIELQGIVEVGAGYKAIINDEMVSEGDLVRKAKVVKITSQMVVFIYRGRKFSKSISK